MFTDWVMWSRVSESGGKEVKGSEGWRRWGSFGVCKLAVEEAVVRECGLLLVMVEEVVIGKIDGCCI